MGLVMFYVKEYILCLMNVLCPPICWSVYFRDSKIPTFWRSRAYLEPRLHQKVSKKLAETQLGLAELIPGSQIKSLHFVFVAEYLRE